MIALRPSNFLKTCESLLTWRRARRLHKNTPSPRDRRVIVLTPQSPPQTHEPASATRIGVSRRRAAAGLFLARLTRADARRTGEDGSTPFWRKAGTSLFTYKSRAWRMRYAQAQFQLVKCASRRGSSGGPFQTVQRTGKDDMAPVFGEGGNLPTRFFELDREMLKREGFDFEKFAKKVRRRSKIQYQLATSQAMQDTVTSRELFERMPTRPALAEPEVAAHKVRSYEDDSTDWAPIGGRAAAPEQPAQPARRRPVRSTRNRDPVYTGQKTIGGTAPKRSAPLVRVGTELRFELIAKPALASHVHGADPRPTWISSLYDYSFSQANGPSASWATFSPSPSSTCSILRRPCFRRPLETFSRAGRKSSGCPTGPWS